MSDTAQPIPASLPPLAQVPGAASTAVKPPAGKRLLQLSTWRGTQSQFKSGAARVWFVGLMVDELIQMSQSESDGNVCISIVYR